MVSKKGRELEFPCIGNYSSQRGVEGNLNVESSLISLCSDLGVDPCEWMKDVLLRNPGNENNRDVLRGLLLDRWQSRPTKINFCQLGPNLTNFCELCKVGKSLKQINKAVLIGGLPMMCGLFKNVSAGIRRGVTVNARKMKEER